MATAYHLEVLRKQRVIDRANEAKKKLAIGQVMNTDPPPDETQTKQSSKRPSRSNSRPSSAQSTASKRSKISGHGDDGVTVEDTAARPVSPSSLKRTDETAGSLSSKHSTRSASRPSTAPTTGRSSAPSSASSRKSDKRLSRLSTAELKAEIVRQDLQKQEKVLHDSNLVMGEVAVKDEMEARQLDPGATSV